LYASFDFGTDYPKAPPYLQQFDYESNLKAKIQDIIDYFKSLGNVQGQVLGFCFGGWLIANIFASDQNEFFSCGAIGHPSITFEEIIYGRCISYH
jgi:dienelactone hydrolase